MVTLLSASLLDRSRLVDTPIPSWHHLCQHLETFPPYFLNIHDFLPNLYRQVSLITNSSTVYPTYLLQATQPLQQPHY